jgi:hypothetical protein
VAEIVGSSAFQPNRVGMLGFDGVAGLDLLGPIEVFDAANSELARRFARQKAKQERSSFLKKRSKRLLRIGLEGAGNSEPRSQKFFGSFFQKRTPSLPYSSFLAPLNHPAGIAKPWQITPPKI